MIQAKIVAKQVKILEADEESVDTMEEIGEDAADMGENKDADESEEECKNE